ncbi:MAG: DivIVA domain-containing protein [Erysipelotrichaceae bacterium]|nr:DivIVA domain-containing protein [Erysipelotrichaceae bacterium]
MNKLNLSPEDIVNQQFDVAFKGYDPAVVDSFLDTVLEDYDIMEANVQELLDMIASLKEQVKELSEENKDLKARRSAFDLSNTTTYSSVDVLKRLSRLEEMMYNNK